jgi:hypothetical protein
MITMSYPTGTLYSNRSSVEYVVLFANGKVLRILPGAEEFVSSAVPAVEVAKPAPPAVLGEVK